MLVCRLACPMMYSYMRGVFHASYSVIHDSQQLCRLCVLPTSVDSSYLQARILDSCTIRIFRFQCYALVSNYPGFCLLPIGTVGFRFGA